MFPRLGMDRQRTKESEHKLPESCVRERPTGVIVSWLHIDVLWMSGNFVYGRFVYQTCSQRKRNSGRTPSLPNSTCLVPASTHICQVPCMWGQRLLKDLMKQNGTTPPFQVAVHCSLSIGYHGKDCSDSWSYLVYLGMLNATFYCILVLSCLILCQIRCCFIKLSGSKSVELFGPLCWPPRKKARCWSSCSHGPDRLFNCDAMKIFHCPTKIAVCSQTQNSISDYYSSFPRGMVNESLSSAGPKSSKSDSETHRCFQPTLCTMSSTSFWHTKRTDMFSLFCMGIMCE